ncbi:MAG: hypothetical protein E7436_02360 [Ruminococcaceae bacterium]|nr:hypothetical protein [Oscillospiraceae bacterium]
MRNKKWLRILVPVIVVAVIAGGIAAMILFGSAREKLVDRYSSAPELTNKVSANEEQPLISRNGMKLYLLEDMAVRMEDQNGTVWSTNGQGLDGNTTKNQFTLSYYTANAAYSFMESQYDSVDKGQAQAFLEDEVLYVRYQVGSYGKTVDAVPQYMTGERFQEMFASRLNEEDLAEMEGYYKYYKDDNAWRIRSKGRNNFERILVLMDKVGYTDEDLVRDNGDGGITTDVSSKPWFTIVLAYELTEDGLSVSMPVERIEFNADFPLYEVELLPHFGKEVQDPEGYVLLPDGSGALMHFTDTYNSRATSRIPIYGLDWSVASDTLATGQYQYENAALPVFGMKDGQDAYFAVIEGGDTKAALVFHQAGTYLSRNEVYPVFRMVNKDSVYLSGSDNSSKVILFESSLAEETCAVHYRFMAQGSGYVEMAALYRDLLLADGTLTELESGSVSLLLETIGGVMSNKNLLGISYEGVTAATTYEQNRLIAEDLLEAGVENLDLKLIGWFNDGVYHDYAGNIKLNSVLGGKKAWLALVEYAQSAGVGLYPDVDFQRIEEMDWGFLPTTDAAIRLDSNEATFSILSRALLLEKEDIGLTPQKLYLLSPRRYQTVAESFLKDFAAIRTSGLSLRSTRVYSDFNSRNMISRPEALELLLQQLELLGKDQDLMLESGARYAFGYTQKMSGVASDSSHFRVADHTVPFLQMVLHGSMQMYTSPINLASNSETAVLRAIEYGMLPNFQVTYAPSSVLKKSEYTDNYASGYESWRGDILKAYSMIHDSLEGLMDQPITDHTQVAEEVFATTYANGVVVYVNYSESDVTVNGVTVPARSFARQGGAGA